MHEAPTLGLSVYRGRLLMFPHPDRLNPGSISEGSRASLFGSSTAVAIFSPITARRTTVEPKQASADGSQSENGSNSQEGESL